MQSSVFNYINPIGFFFLQNRRNRTVAPKDQLKYIKLNRVPKQKDQTDRYNNKIPKTTEEIIIPTSAKVRDEPFPWTPAFLNAIILQTNPAIGIKKDKTRPTIANADIELSSVFLLLLYFSVAQPQCGQTTASSRNSLPQLKQYFILFHLSLF